MSTEPSSPADQSYTYADAGVSIAAGNALVRAIGRSPRRPGGRAPTPTWAASAACSI
jgi:phosphoribosylformylglycinamidine cyclo-ligase